MATYDDHWFEIWYTDGELIPVYLLIVTSERKSSGEIKVVDPFKNNQVVYVGKNYEDICTWLWDDDYHLAEGRIFPDDGW